MRHLDLIAAAHRTIALSLALTILVVPQPLNARITRQWTYQEMMDQADLVAIATVISTKDAGPRTTLPDYTPPLNVIPVISEFQTRIVFKGGKDTAKFFLFHYKYESEDDEFATANNPELIKIDPRTQSTFLLFLAKERDGRYVPVSGQTDPAALSILDLRSGAN